MVQRMVFNPDETQLRHSGKVISIPGGESAACKNTTGKPPFQNKIKDLSVQKGRGPGVTGIESKGHHFLMGGKPGNDSSPEQTGRNERKENRCDQAIITFHK